MITHVALRLAALVALGSMTACGGGGGNPGTCVGSVEVCEKGGNTNVGTAGTTPSASDSTATTTTTTASTTPSGSTTTTTNSAPGGNTAP